MRLVTVFCCGMLASALAFGVWPGVVHAQRVPVVEGPLTPEAPFGICPVTNRARTASDFYQLFGYLPKSAGHFPGVPTSPPPNWPKTYYTPRRSSANPARANVSPPANNIPKKKPAPKPPVAPAANQGTNRLAQLTKEDAARMTSELQGRNRKLLDETANRLTAAPGGATAPRTAAARQALDAVRAQLNDGTLRNADLVNLVNALRGVVPDDVVAVIGQVAVNQQLFVWLRDARTGANPIPGGGNVPIALIPGLQPGVIIPLGFGPTLIGMGRTIDTVILGEGNVLQAAGLPAPDGPPVPAYDGTIATGAVILTNVGQGAVNYLVNGSTFTMQPKYSQDLEGGRAWTVDFDRGGGFGAAQYQVTPGWYEFTETPRGWELYRKSFEVHLENGNDFDFRYVLDNQTRQLSAGRMEQFASEYPPVIRFDDAQGRVKQKRLTDKKYGVAVTAGGALEVYPASSIPEPPKAASLVVRAAPGSAAVAADSSAPVAKPFTLPVGFLPLDPVELLTAAADKSVAKAKIPAAFTMFTVAEGGASER